MIDWLTDTPINKWPFLKLTPLMGFIFSWRRLISHSFQSGSLLSLTCFTNFHHLLYTSTRCSLYNLCEVICKHNFTEVLVNSLTPGALAWILATKFSKRHLQHDRMPFVPQEYTVFMTFLLGHSQKSKFLFGQNFLNFFVFPSFPFVIFLLQWMTLLGLFPV